MKKKLIELAYARSGDKGSNVNIGLIARTPKDYALLKKLITAEKVQAFFMSLNPLETIRYDLPNLHAFNFVLKGVLQGGGSLSLRSDAQGKALGQALLEMEIEDEYRTVD